MLFDTSLESFKKRYVTPESGTNPRIELLSTALTQSAKKIKQLEWGENHMVIDEIHRIARDENISVFGTGPASEMADEPMGYRPEDFMPGAQSLLCFGIPIPRDVFGTPNYSLETTWRSQNLLYRRLDTLSLRFSILLEESSDRAIPIYGCMPMSMNKDGVIGYVNQLRMAEITKIGVIGKNSLLIHSQHGARLMLGGVITTASLPVMHYPDIKEAGCPSDCHICSEICPVDAIMPENKKVHIKRCMTYTSKTPFMSKLKFLFLMARNKKAAARYMSITTIDENLFHICSKCVSLCPYGDEQK